MQYFDEHVEYQERNSRIIRKAQNTLQLQIRIPYDIYPTGIPRSSTGSEIQ